MKAFILAVSILIGTRVVAQNAPSLQETFDWMSSTLQPSEGNNSVTHRPFERPYSQDWKAKNIDPFSAERISQFSHNDCDVQLNINEIDHDSFPEIGRVFNMNFEYTFNLRDLDPASIHILDSCTPIATSSGPVEPWNCHDKEGKYIGLNTANAKPTIHKEVTTSAYKSMYGLQQYKWEKKKLTWDGMCTEVEQKGGAEEGTYCDFKDKKDKPKDVTSLEIGFSTPQYANRFAKALRHAVELCGGKPSTF